MRDKQITEEVLHYLNDASYNYATEIDFVAEKQNEKIYIQIAQRISNEETEKREYGNLLKIQDNYPKYVLRTDVFTGGNRDGIKTMHVADFLLSHEY